MQHGVHVFLERQDKAMATGPYVSMNGNLTVNNGSLTCPAGGGRQVVVTPLVAGSQQRVQGVGTGRVLVSHAHPQPPQPQQPRVQVPNPNVLPKALLKARSVNKKDSAKMFTLHNLDLSAIKAVTLQLRSMM